MIPYQQEAVAILAVKGGHCKNNTVKVVTCNIKDDMCIKKKWDKCAS
jgi:hypothetical protein